VTKEDKVMQDAAVREILIRHSQGWVHGTWPTPGIRVPPLDLPPMQVAVPSRAPLTTKKNPNKGKVYGKGNHGPYAAEAKPAKKVKSVPIRHGGQR
jgi:hypothetical protein